MSDARSLPDSLCLGALRPGALRLGALALIALAATSLLTATPLRAAAQPEYASLLSLGRAAYDRRDYPAAVRDFRLACFGMLDEPKLLADCLTRLALAQDKANDLEGFQQSFQRLEEIEEKFSAYSQGELAAELRSALEPRIVARIPAVTLEATTGFRFLSPKKPDTLATNAKGAPAPPAGKGGKPAAPAGPVVTAPGPTTATAVPPGEKPKAPPATVSPPPDSTRTKPQTTSPAPLPSVPPASSPPKPPTAPGTTTAPTAPAVRPWSDAEREKVQQARDKLTVEQTAHELKSIFDTVKEVADAHPESRDTQHLVGQAAYRLSRWNEALSYFKRGGDPGDEQSELLFYIAVAQYESGDATSAAATLKRSLPNLKRTAYVDKYAKKILGQ